MRRAKLLFSGFIVTMATAVMIPIVITLMPSIVSEPAVSKTVPAPVVSTTVSSPSEDIKVTIPFSWQGAIWCPTYEGGQGCDNTQRILSARSSFSPSQVTKIGSSNYIRLQVNSAATTTGAFNTQKYKVWYAPAMISEQINLPCDSSGQIDNWPAFWLNAASSRSAGAEIDVMEGLGGYAAWHYHYVNSSGLKKAVGHSVAGFNGCGTHTYAVKWTTVALTFYYDGRQVGRVTPSQIGVPISSGPMYAINDYAASYTYGGPVTGGVSMEVFRFSS